MSHFGTEQPEEWGDDPSVVVLATPPAVFLPTSPDTRAMDDIARIIRAGQTDMLARIEEAVARTGRLQVAARPSDALTGVPGPAIDDVDGASELDATPEDPTP